MSNKAIVINEQESVLEGLKKGLVNLYHTGNTWIQRQKTRRQLAQLPGYLLRDIGLSEADRYRESNKHFWQN